MAWHCPLKYESLLEYNRLMKEIGNFKEMSRTKVLYYASGNSYVFRRVHHKNRNIIFLEMTSEQQFLCLAWHAC